MKKLLEAKLLARETGLIQIICSESGVRYVVYPCGRITSKLSEKQLEQLTVAFINI